MTTPGNGDGDIGDLPDIESSGGVTPSVKGLYIQPFPGGQGTNDPISKFMLGSNKPEEYIPLTNVNQHEISQDERILYNQNIANYANGMLHNVMLYGYNLRRALNGRTAEDVVNMVSGNRQMQQRQFQAQNNQTFQRSKGPLSNTSEMSQ